MSELPETFVEAVHYFAAGDNALNFMVALRWPDGVVCPTCGSRAVRFMEKRKVWECREKHPRRQFSVKVGTVFEDSPIALSKWLCALWQITNCKNGISSYELHRALGVTQKTAWFMLHRLRLAMQGSGIVRDQMQGTVEVDESYIGGKARNMHKKAKELRGLSRTGMVGKSVVMGLLERGDEHKPSKVRAEVIAETKRHIVAPKVRQYVLKGSEVHTDQHQVYNDLHTDYAHKIVDHAKTYVQDGVHTNGLENFWSLLKRTIKGTYVSVEPFHLFRYLSEQVFRFNERKDKDGDRGRFLSVACAVIGKRLMYRQLIGDNDGLPGPAHTS